MLNQWGATDWKQEGVETNWLLVSMVSWLVGWFGRFIDWLSDKANMQASILRLHRQVITFHHISCLMTFHWILHHCFQRTKNKTVITQTISLKHNLIMVHNQPSCCKYFTSFSVTSWLSPWTDELPLTECCSKLFKPKMFHF